MRLLTFILIFISSLSYSQEWYPVILMIGRNVVNTLDNHHYKPVNFLIQVPYLLKESGETDKLFFVIEPNFSVVHIRRRLEDISKDEFEGGVILGLKQSHYINKIVIFSEPYFGFIGISEDTKHQSGGFNFNLGYSVGASYKFKKVEVSYSAKYRHISNAGLRLPNSGIDNLLMYIGITGI